MQQTPLTAQLAGQISERIHADNTPAGTRLVERKLAEEFKVSRSPIRSALRLLETQGVVSAVDGGGYAVNDNRGRARPDGRAEPAEETIYRTIADDRLDGRLPDRVTEAYLTKRYDLTRAQLARILRRISNEGWIARLPGHGWEFLPMLTSMRAYEDSYRFRLTIEPAAILEPGFVLNPQALRLCRAQQQELVDGGIWSISSPDLFDANSRLHETIIECSRNAFFIEGLRRIDTLRRLIEYRQSLDRKRAIIRCREHVQLVDLLLAGRNAEASAFMRRHLSTVSIEKIVQAQIDGD